MTSEAHISVQLSATSDSFRQSGSHVERNTGELQDALTVDCNIVDHDKYQ